eukprot:scaffold193_cov255-Pinguiococcus_pyrenoidosus.AAC.43
MLARSEVKVHRGRVRLVFVREERAGVRILLHLDHGIGRLCPVIRLRRPPVELPDIPACLARAGEHLSKACASFEHGKLPNGARPQLHWLSRR